MFARVVAVWLFEGLKSQWAFKRRDLAGEYELVIGVLGTVGNVIRIVGSATAAGGRSI
jgi:hypothetical protein